MRHFGYLLILFFGFSVTKVYQDAQNVFVCTIYLSKLLYWFRFLINIYVHKDYLSSVLHVDISFMIFSICKFFFIANYVKANKRGRIEIIMSIIIHLLISLLIEKFSPATDVYRESLLQLHNSLFV